MKRVLRTTLLVLAVVVGLALLLALTPLLLLLLLIPAHFSGSYENSTFSGLLRYAFLKFRIGGAKGEKTEKKEKPRKKTEKKKKTKPEKKPGKKPKAAGKHKMPLSETVGLVRQLADAGFVALGSLLRHTPVRELYVRAAVATEDAADTAILCGRMFAGAGVLFGPLYRAKNVKKLHIEFAPDFEGTKTDWTVRWDVSVRGIRVVGAVLRGGFAFLCAILRRAASKDEDKNDTNTQHSQKGGKKMAHSIENMIGTSIQKIREMADVNTMIGDPIKVSDTITIIPVSRVSLGFASGGSDIPSKQDKELFGGGAGAGIKLDPVAFIVINGDSVQILPNAVAPAPGADRAISMVPDILDKVSDLFGKKKKTDDAPVEPLPQEETDAQ